MQQAALVHSTGLIPATGTSIRFLTRRPAAVLSDAQRVAVEAEVERLIALLDAADGDPDIEFNGDEFEDAEGDERTFGLRVDYSTAVATAPPGASDDDEDEDLAAEIDNDLADWWTEKAA